MLVVLYSRFPNLCELAIRYLSAVPCNSVDAERSVSQYNLVDAPQRQSLGLSDGRLALRVMNARNAKSYRHFALWGTSSWTERDTRRPITVGLIFVVLTSCIA